MNRAITRSLLLICLPLAAAACGQKGPLFIPGDIAATETVSVSEETPATGITAEDGEESATEASDE